ncbi:MAG: site-2 protease family protein [Pseudomonadota bacterium]
MAIGWKRWLIHGTLFLLALGTTTLVNGPLYGVSIVTLLLAHELGHYLMCRRYGVAATLPIFIPFPNLLGTMGAVISIRSPIPSRKALFDIGVAGPLAGLALALPVLTVGLALSDVRPLPVDGTGLFFGEPLLFHWISSAIVGTVPAGSDVYLHPLAFAGWAVLFVTALNLFPIGQLDGGHLAYALFGRRGRYVSWLTIPVMLYLGYAYHPMWYFFVVILLLLTRHPPPIDDQTPLDRKRIAIAIVVFLLFVLCFTPVPFDYRS